MIAEPMIDSATFREACGHFPTGVTVVTAVDGSGTTAAITVNSFTSVSLDPPQVLFCIGETSTSYGIVSNAEHLAIHILGREQAQLAAQIAVSGRPVAEKLEGVAWTAGPSGVPVIEEAPAVIVGTISQKIVSGDHLVVVVDVQHMHLTPAPTAALTFYRGRYAELPHSD